MRRALLLVVLTLLAAPCSSWSAATDMASVEVDARESPRGILKAHLVLPVSPGPLTLVYPKWLPGRHSPAGPITSLAGPRLTAAGSHIEWRRDAVDPYSFHLIIPPGVAHLEADLEVLTAPAPDGIVQGLETPRTATESLTIVEWNQLVLYTADAHTDALQYQASLRLPPGWHWASALTARSGTAEVIEFEPTSLTELVDSTLLAGRHTRTLNLGGAPEASLFVAADQRAALAIPAPMLAHFQALVPEARALFGAVHYRRYQFLWALTDQIMPDGLEHHESSDDRSPLRALIDEDTRRAEMNLLPHEYIHSWNGKYRRPVGLATPNYQEPMHDELLWVYEGLTEYLSDVLAVRSGLYTAQEFRDELARIAGQMAVHHGREWRSLQDTADAAPLLYHQDESWAARLRRQDDFYQESALLWLEADALIRRESRGRRSLDDFCRRFFGAPDSGPQVRPYGFEDVIATLDAVQPADWRAFWLERLQRVRREPPLEGIQQAGWTLSYSDTPGSLDAGHAAESRSLNLQYSLGMVVGLEGGALSDIVPGSPADLAGLAPGSHLIAVNGHKFSRDTLHEALAASPETKAVTLLIEKDEEYRSIPLSYAGGERYPRLSRGSGADLLAEIARPRAARP